MNSFRLFGDRVRVTYAVAAFALLFAAVMPVFAAAAQVTDRSIALSSSSAGATGVAYTVNFTAVAATAGAVVIDFCSNSPLLGQTCDAPTGFNASSAATVTPGFTMGTLSASAANKVAVTGTMTASQNVSIALTGITNPTSAGPLYARIVTYTDTAGSAGYTSANPDAAQAHLDDGGVAMYITNKVGVSGVVLESMTFCVANKTITDNCGNAGTPGNEPILKLGETVGDTVALTTGAVSTGSIYTQLSTNAASGVVVNLKSDALGCGGLMRAGAPTKCDIKPTLAADLVAGTATFGVKAAAVADTGATPNGVFQAANGYNATTYALNWATGDTTGVTSTFGDQILNTNGQPVNGKNMMLTFGASVSNSTPAGSYSTDLSLIATGKY